MNRQHEVTSRPLGPNVLSVIMSAYDLALLEIADSVLELKISSLSGIKTELSLAILDAFNNGVSDVQVLRMIGLAAVTINTDPDASTFGRGAMKSDVTPLFLRGSDCEVQFRPLPANRRTA